MSYENEKKGTLSLRDASPAEGPATTEKMMADMKAMFEQKMTQIVERMQSEIGNMQSEMGAMKGRLSHVDELETRCKHLEGKCGSLERSLRVLASRWDFSAPAIPSSHWTERGFDESYIGSVDRFFRNIQEVASRRPEDVCFDTISLGHPGAQTVLHDDVLLPHWQILADALDLYGPLIGNSRCGFSFHLWNVQLTPDVMKLLTPSLKSGKLKSLVLWDNELINVGDGIEFAIEIAQGNPSLDRFAWKNAVGSLDDANCLVEAIVSHPSIQRVSLCNSFTEGDRFLQSLISGNKHFDRIAFSGNDTRTVGVTQISDYLRTNPPLYHLDLRHNHLDDNDAILIADALKRNTHLEQLALLDGNDISELGEKALQNAIFDQTSYLTAAQSNHTCCIQHIGGIPSMPNMYNNLVPNANRKTKLFNLMASRNRMGTNVHHLSTEFDGDSLGLVPNVLASVYINSRASRTPIVNPLSILYEILRSWKMPSLFERRDGVSSSDAE